MTWQLLADSVWIEGRSLSRHIIAPITEERKDPAVFILIGTPKTRTRKKTKLFQAVSIASARASATGIRQDIGIRIEMR